jgi:hypothetical protein
MDKTEFALTDRFNDEARDISINSLIEERLKTIGDDENLTEYKCIVVGMAFLIIHEIGHLLLRWKGVHKSPEFKSTCLEAGDHLEAQLFGFKVRYIMSHKKKWDATTEMKGIILYLTYSLLGTF